MDPVQEERLLGAESPVVHQPSNENEYRTFNANPTDQSQVAYPTFQQQPMPQYIPNNYNSPQFGQSPIAYQTGVGQPVMGFPNMIPPQSDRLVVVQNFIPN